VAGRDHHKTRLTAAQHLSGPFSHKRIGRGIVLLQQQATVLGTMSDKVYDIIGVEERRLYGGGRGTR
jgi:hypothetical protein